MFGGLDVVVKMRCCVMMRRDSTDGDTRGVIYLLRDTDVLFVLALALACACARAVVSGSMQPSVSPRVFTRS